ncbi:MAG: hypothetical protein H0V30_11735 [Chitinophagaceae bacterium]|nr:hypothetical protein [Chitinophagaceae bacterium]
MKAHIIYSVALFGLTMQACNNDSTTDTIDSETETTTTASGSSSTEMSGSMSTTSNYVDLNTNQPVELIWDDENDRAINRATNQPVELYINTATRDTIYGPGYIVNNHIIRTNTGNWLLDETKIKREGDELKIKKDGMKFKMEDGEWKMKTDDGKIKSDGDELKIKSEDGKIKVEDGKTKIKSDN